jgi:hypothetical protein
MNPNILDAPEKENTQNQRLKTLKDGLPILILCAVICYSIFVYITTDYVATTARILGIMGVFLSALIFIFNRTIGACFFTTILFLSLFGFIKFTPTYWTISIFGITLPPYPTALFLFTFFWQKSYLEIGLTQFKNITIVKKIIDFWQSIPD